MCIRDRICNSFAKNLIDGSASPGFNSPLIIIFFICVVICSYIGLSLLLLIIICTFSLLSCIYCIYLIYTIYTLIYTLSSWYMQKKSPRIIISLKIVVMMFIKNILYLIFPNFLIYLIYRFLLIYILYNLHILFACLLYTSEYKFFHIDYLLRY